VEAIRAVVPYMCKHGGRIILIGSLGGDMPIPYDSFYSSSKAALDMLAKELRVELKPYKISVTSVRPGGTATGFTFKRKVYSDTENGGYSKGVNKAVAALNNMEQGGMSAVAVADCIVNAVRSESPPITLSCGGKNKGVMLVNRLLPERFVSMINARSYNL